ncbi:unnamed protein product [Schistosoma curassoni]|uniref:Ovule protein n=1 Tax=Schistosoma curassoni TaxID=6186 RepID=A0A183KDV9_9TREM|nr:unnamed protein product [Schistosoma curassoni]
MRWTGPQHYLNQEQSVSRVLHQILLYVKLCKNLMYLHQLFQKIRCAKFHPRSNRLFYIPEG